MFRGKESSNRIELSRLVQELSNFGVFGFLRLLGVGAGWGLGGGWMLVGGLGGAPHTCAHACMHAHARTCIRGKHGNFMQMAAPIGFGEIPGIPYDVIWACMWVGCTLSPPSPIHPPPTPQGGNPRNHSKFNST